VIASPSDIACTPFVNVTVANAIEPFRLICLAPARVYGELTEPTFGSEATLASVPSTLERTLGCLTLPVPVAITIWSVSPETLGAACCKRLCAAALWVPESWFEAE
jgi:hypothetical protein